MAFRSPAPHPARGLPSLSSPFPQEKTRPPRRASSARLQVLRCGQGAGLEAALWTLSAPGSCRLQPQGHCISRAEETLPHRARPLSCSGSGFAWGQAPSGKEESRHLGSFGDNDTGTWPRRIWRRPAFTAVIVMHSGRLTSLPRVRGGRSAPAPVSPEPAAERAETRRGRAALGDWPLRPCGN